MSENIDAYMDGNCKRCGRVRAECHKIIESGRRCTEPEDLPRFMVSPDLFENSVKQDVQKGK